MYDYIHYSGNVSGKCLSSHNVTPASVIIRDVIPVCLYGPNGLQMVCESLIGAVLHGISCQCNIAVIGHGGTGKACICIVRYDWLWTPCHVCISSHPLNLPCPLMRWPLYHPIIFFLCITKSVSSRGFVNMSAICSPVATWYILTVPFFTSSLKWWYLMLRCFVLGLILGTFAISIAPSLSSNTLQWILHGLAVNLAWLSSCLDASFLYFLNQHHEW